MPDGKPGRFGAGRPWAASRSGGRGSRVAMAVAVVAVLGFGLVALPAGAGGVPGPTALSVRLGGALLEPGGQDVLGLGTARSTSQGIAVDSENWAGYVVCPDLSGTSCPAPTASETHVTGVRASFVATPAAVTSSGTEASATWVGVGGFAVNDLVQAGVFAEPETGGGTVLTAWWEMLPASATAVELAPDPTISAGDAIFVSVVYSGLSAGDDQQWTFEIDDNTTASAWVGEETCSGSCLASTFDSADWIEESPELGSTIVELPAFATVPVTAAQYENGTGAWQPLNGSAADLVALSILNPSYSSAVVALVSDVASPGTFWLQYLVDAEDPYRSGSGGGVTAGQYPAGAALPASLELTSPDSFGASGPTDLGIAAALGQDGTVTCLTSSGAAVGFSVTAGTAGYATDGRICGGLASGTYESGLTLWYVPTGASIGSPSSLELYSTPLSTAAPVVVSGPLPGPISSQPATGAIDLGGSLVLSVSPMGGAPPYGYDWLGLPSGCPSSNASELACEPTATGEFSVQVNVTDSQGGHALSPSLAVEVAADPVIASGSLSTRSLYEGDTVTMAVTVGGGLPPFTYRWTGLPSDCSTANASTLSCAPLSSGAVRVTVEATDSVGRSANATFAFTVVPALYGVPWVEIVLGAVAAGLALALLIGTVVFLTRRYPTPATGARPAPAARGTPAAPPAVCGRCGGSVPSGSFYCPHCGFPTPESGVKW